MLEAKTYTVRVRYEPHECGMCGPSARSIITVSDGKRERTTTQALCDNSDQITPYSALEWFIEGEEDEDDAD